MTAKLNRNIIMTFGPESRFIGMRCYFNLVNGIDKITDLDGIEVQDIEHALAQAMKAIEELREEDHAAPSDWADWSLEVTDFFGAVLFSIDLGEVLH
jgi:hypothetical protein